MSEKNRFFSNKDLRRLIIPLIIDQFLQAFVGFADSIMVASVGEAAVSGVSLIDTVMVLIINIFTALATGGAVIAGQFIGKKRHEMACKSTNQLISFTLKASVVVMILGYLGRNFITHVVFGKIEADVLYNCNVYLLIVFASIPMIALYNAGAAVFRAMGNSSVAMRTSLLMNAINICGNAILIFGFHRGVEGVAIPTLVSRTVACIVMLCLLNNQNQVLHIYHPFSFKTDWSLLKKILYIGIPNGLENSMFQLGKILVLSIVTGFGTASIAANAVSNNVATFAVLPGMAMGFAMLTVTAQCVGAGDFEQVSYYTKKLLKVAYISLVAINIVVVLVVPFIIKIYGLSEEASTYAYRILIYHSACVVTIWPLSFSLPNTLRAAADVRYTMLLSIVSMWIFRIGFSVVLGVYLGMGVFGVWVAMTIDWLFRAICFVFRYVRGKWKHAALV
ncbi:MAG: MATE family efflux transporter [Blautia sp.]|jgi:putative MATE family efflux protein